MDIRNFCIIAHIDHGKSTLADRLLEATGTVPARQMRDQLLDQMDLERERGITIKLQPARMHWRDCLLNLIDTPGHVDFSYEVSRSLAACEGALLLVDATQGIQAQTLANYHLAIRQGLTLIPVINKVDLPAARTEEVRQSLALLLGCRPEEALLVSAKTGQGVAAVLDAIIERIPSPRGDAGLPFRALIFDSHYDDYQGIVASIRVVDGSVRVGQPVRLLSAGINSTALAVGIYTPGPKAAEALQTGEIGYLVTGLKSIGQVRVGDTVGAIEPVRLEPLPGYAVARPMVFAGLYPATASDFEQLREALARLQLNDASLSYEPEQSLALGSGFRCGFLGLLHLEIVQERLRREYQLQLVLTAPSVAYQVTGLDGEVRTIRRAQDLPAAHQRQRLEEPMVEVEVVTPSGYVGTMMNFLGERRGEYLALEYLDQRQALLRYRLPLQAILVDFYDQLKSISSGYATMNYTFAGWRAADVIRLDILVAEEVVEPLSAIVYDDEAYAVGRRVVERLRSSLPRQLFEVKLQASVGSKVIAADRIPPLRKEVAKLSGGDITRKRKLLEKQRAGKRRMQESGRVEIPPEVYLSLLRSR